MSDIVSSDENLFTLKKNTILMMKDRGYDVSSEELLLTWDFNQFYAHYRGMASEMKNNPPWANFFNGLYPTQITGIRRFLTKVYQSNTGKPNVLVAFVEEEPEKEKIGVTGIQNIIRVLENMQIINATFILPKKTTSQVKDLLSGYLQRRYTIFHDIDLLKNPTKNTAVPIYHKLTPEERANFFTPVKDLMLMRSTDIIAKWYDYQPGDIIFIRVKLPLPKSVLPSETYYYRVIVRSEETSW